MYGYYTPQQIPAGPAYAPMGFGGGIVGSVLGGAVGKRLGSESIGQFVGGTLGSTLIPFEAPVYGSPAQAHVPPALPYMAPMQPYSVPMQPYGQDAYHPMFWGAVAKAVAPIAKSVATEAVKVAAPHVIRHGKKLLKQLVPMEVMPYGPGGPVQIQYVEVEVEVEADEDQALAPMSLMPEAYAPMGGRVGNFINKWADPVASTIQTAGKWAKYLPFQAQPIPYGPPAYYHESPGRGLRPARSRTRPEIDMRHDTETTPRDDDARWIVSERRDLPRPLGPRGLRDLLRARRIDMIREPDAGSGPARAVIRAAPDAVAQLRAAHGEILLIAEDRPLDPFG